MKHNAHVCICMCEVEIFVDSAKHYIANAYSFCVSVMCIDCSLLQWQVSLVQCDGGVDGDGWCTGLCVAYSLSSMPH